MRLRNLLWTIAAVVAGSQAALASDAEGNCVAFSESNDIDPAPCSCIAEAIGGNEELLAEQASLQTLEDYDAASDELKAAIGSCTG